MNNEIAVDVPDLDELGGDAAEGIDDAIAVEGAVVRLLVPVPAVCEIALWLSVGSNFSGRFPYGLVNPVPDAPSA